MTVIFRLSSEMCYSVFLNRFDSRFLCGYFSGLSHTSDLKIGSLVAPLPSAWSYRVSAGTGQPGVSIL